MGQHGGEYGTFWRRRSHRIHHHQFRYGPSSLSHDHLHVPDTLCRNPDILLGNADRRNKRDGNLHEFRIEHYWRDFHFQPYTNSKQYRNYPSHMREPMTTVQQDSN